MRAGHVLARSGLLSHLLRVARLQAGYLRLQCLLARRRLLGLLLVLQGHAGDHRVGYLHRGLLTRDLLHERRVVLVHGSHLLLDRVLRCLARVCHLSHPRVRPGLGVLGEIAQPLDILQSLGLQGIRAASVLIHQLLALRLEHADHHDRLLERHGSRARVRVLHVVEANRRHHGHESLAQLVEHGVWPMLRRESAWDRARLPVVDAEKHLPVLDRALLGLADGASLPVAALHASLEGEAEEHDDGGVDFLSLLEDLLDASNDPRGVLLWREAQNAPEAEVVAEVEGVAAAEVAYANALGDGGRQRRGDAKGRVRPLVHPAEHAPPGCDLVDGRLYPLLSPGLDDRLERGKVLEDGLGGGHARQALDP